MRSFKLENLVVARARSEEIMRRIARALVEAETDRAAELDATAAIRFLDSIDKLLPTVPYATLRLLIQLGEHGSPAVRRAAAGATRALVGIAPVAAEGVLSRLADDPQAPVRTAAARALGGLLACSPNPFDVVERWLNGTPGQRAAMERARRLVPAPIGTAPIRTPRPQLVP